MFFLGHSDPEKLKESAQVHEGLSPSELQKRHIEIKVIQFFFVIMVCDFTFVIYLWCALFVAVKQELMEKTKMLSDAELMKISISDLNNVSISLEDRYRALLELLELVEPLDNANGIAIFLSMFICF